MNILIRKVFFIFFLSAIVFNAFSQTIAEDFTQDSSITIFSQASENYTPKIKVITNSEGANVFLDGELKGKTPLTIENVLQGFHLIQIEKDGYITKRFQITVQPYSNLQVIIELEQKDKQTQEPKTSELSNSEIDNTEPKDTESKGTETKDTESEPTVSEGTVFSNEKRLFVTTSGTYNGSIKNFIKPQNELRQMQISISTAYKINSMFLFNAKLSPQYSFIADDMSDGASFSFDTKLEFSKDIIKNFSMNFSAGYNAEINDTVYSLFLYSPKEIPGLYFTTDFSWANKPENDRNKNIFNFAISPGIIYGGTSGFFKDSIFISQTKLSAKWINEKIDIAMNVNCNQNLQNLSQIRLQGGILGEYKFSKQDLSLGLKNEYVLTGTSQGKEFSGFSITCFCTISN